MAKEAQDIRRNLGMRLSPKKLAIAQRRQEVASMYLSAEPQWKIAQHFGVHPGQISRDLRALQKQWQEAALFDLNKVKARELARLDEIERKASRAWDHSCKDAETMEVTGTSTGGKGKPEKVRKITKGQTGDPRFLAIVLDCVKQRREILGLDAPKQTKHSGPQGDESVHGEAFDAFLEVITKALEPIPGGGAAVAKALEVFTKPAKEAA